MNILASIHLYPPKHNCGAEWMLHHMLKDLTSKGHNVRVLLLNANKYSVKNNYCFDGIDVFPPNPNVIDNLFSWADCVFTHLDYTKWTIEYGKMKKIPVFHLIHNTNKYQEIVDAGGANAIEHYRDALYPAWDAGKINACAASCSDRSAAHNLLCR